MPVTIKNFTEFFKQEGDIYVKNVSGCNVSVLFSDGKSSESFLFENKPDPINLTNSIPFALIKQSTDFRKALNRQPVTLQIISQEEFEKYYEQKAKKVGKSVDEIKEEVLKKSQELQNKVPLPKADAEDSKNSDKHDEVVSEDEIINPRILNLCLQVHPSVDPDKRATSQEMLNELETIHDLKFEDWEYIFSHGYYKSLKNLAKQKMNELASQVEGVDDEEEVKDTKKAKKKK